MFWSEQVSRLNLDKVKITCIADTDKILSQQNPNPPIDSWASYPNVGVAIWLIEMEGGSNFSIPVASSEVNRNIYFFEGKENQKGISVGGSVLNFNEGALLAADQPTVISNLSDVKCRLMLLQGRPIGKPVAQSGPFVMNTREELHQAYKDFSKTQFGGWPWPDNDGVHPREQQRFAKLPNGKVLTPEQL